MPKWKTRASWALWRACCLHDGRRFESALRDPDRAQATYLRSVLKGAEGSCWARQYGVDGNTDLRQFQDRVPVQDPGELAGWTDRMVQGETEVLTRAPVERLVPTSGTTGPRKLIPMTRQSRGDYSTAVNLWLLECMRTHSGLCRGRAYIATSPAVDGDLQNGAVPIGFAEDTAYLGLLERHLLHQILAVPLTVASLRDEAWRDATRACLKRADDLTFLSIWHPSYLEALFDENELFELSTRWADLKLISCWADGSCAPAAQRLLRFFPQARLQPKGLWLTEGPVTLPWAGSWPLALLSGFFEFETDQGSILLPSELKPGGMYRPVLTNHAGLYRYRLGDWVQVDSFLKQTPCMRWVGRADRVTDLRGEKISDAQIAVALQEIGWKHAFRREPNDAEHPTGYVYMIDQPEHTFPSVAFEAALRRNPHYDWARRIGQLTEPVIRRDGRGQ